MSHMSHMEFDDYSCLYHFEQKIHGEIGKLPVQIDLSDISRPDEYHYLDEYIPVSNLRIQKF